MGDVREGMGELVLPNGDCYYGSWAGDEKNGHGTFLYKSKGRMLEGEWQKGVARAGEMKNIPDGFSWTSPPSLPLPTQMPKLALLDPDGVLRSALLSASMPISGVGSRSSEVASGGDGNSKWEFSSGEGSSGSGEASRGSTRHSSQYPDGSYSSEAAVAGDARVALGEDYNDTTAPFLALSEENLEVLAGAFTRVDVGNSGYITADTEAMAYILSILNIERPCEEDLEGLLLGLIQDTPQPQSDGDIPPVVSFQAFVKAMASIKV